MDFVSEEPLTCAEIAIAFRLREATVYKLFANERGVLRLPNRRGPDTLRIPRDVFDRVWSRITIGGGNDAAGAQL
jgi:hypothetical protein